MTGPGSEAQLAIRDPIDRVRSTHTLFRRPTVRAILILMITLALVATVIQPATVWEVVAQEPAPSGAHTLGAVVFATGNTTLQANAGPDQTVTEGATVTLNGNASTGNITNFTWMFTYGDLERSINGSSMEFRFAISGVYNVTLNVTDGKGNYSTDVVVVTVHKKPFNIMAYWGEIVTFGAIAAVIAFVYAAVTGRIKSVPEATQEKMKLALKRWFKILSELGHNHMGLMGVIILVFFIGMAILGPTVAPEKINPSILGPYGMYQKPSAAHLLGTDQYRHDIFSELLYGARTSIIVGIVSAIIASLLGAFVGLYSGYAGGWKDEVIMRANDVVLSIPWLVLMIVVAALLRTIDLLGIILIIGLTGWSTTARMVRAQVLSLKERQFVERAKAIGASDLSIIRRHILPNAFPLVFANTILTVAVSILSEATLSFLGMRPVNTITWGTMLSRASDADAFHIGLQGWIILPGLCIVAVVLGFTLLGYALDDIMNPKLRKR